MILSIAIVVLSCTKPRKDFIVKVQLQKLSVKELYNKEVVNDVIFDAQEMDVDSLKNKSRQLFLKAIDQAKNKNKPQEAIALFKSSLLVFPEAKTYYELGNAFMALKGEDNLKEAIKAYKIAEYLQFQPVSNIHYNIACSNYLLYNEAGEDDRESFLYYTYNSLKEAFRSGFSDTALLARDERFHSYLSTNSYKKLIASWVESSGKGSKTIFDLFVASFPARTQPFEIDLQEVEMKNHRESISYDFAAFIPEMENTSFGREVSHDYFLVAKIKETPQYSAIIYSSISFHEEDMQPVTTYITTYDKEGNIISKKIIACQCSASKIKKCKIENDIISVEEYQRLWEHPTDRVSIHDNKVKEYKLVTSSQYRLEETGQITDGGMPVNISDSVSLSLNNHN